MGLGGYWGVGEQMCGWCGSWGALRVGGGECWEKVGLLLVVRLVMRTGGGQAGGLCGAGAADVGAYRAEASVCVGAVNGGLYRARAAVR